MKIFWIEIVMLTKMSKALLNTYLFRIVLSFASNYLKKILGDYEFIKFNYSPR